MVNLPESFYLDPTIVYGGASKTAARKPSPAAVNLHTATVDQLIVLLSEAQYRADAMAIINKKKNKETALQLWNTFNTVYILLQEVTSLYRLLYPPKVAMTESNRVCNALALFQCIASHPDTRMGLVRARVPAYLYPIIKASANERPFEFLKLSCLGVIGALVKIEDSNTPQVVHFLLESEIFPMCLGCMEFGNELTQTVATYILSKMLMQEEGMLYCGVFAERFYVVGSLLAKMTNKLPPEPSIQLLKHIISCFLGLAYVPRLVRAEAFDALKRCFPARLTDPNFIRVAYERHSGMEGVSAIMLLDTQLYSHAVPDNITQEALLIFVEEDPSTKLILEALLHEITAGPFAKPKPAVEVRGGPISKK